MPFQPMLYKAGLSSTIIVESETLVTCVELRIMVEVRSANMYTKCLINVLVYGEGIVIEFVFRR